MRRNWKRITGIVLAFVLIIGQFMAGVSQTQAASKSPKHCRLSSGTVQSERGRA